MDAFKVVNIEGRGRGAVTLRTVRQGETVLSAQPEFLVVDQTKKNQVCSHCFRMLASPENAVECECHEAWFCSADCKEQSRSLDHPAEYCQGLAKMSECKMEDEGAQTTFRVLLRMLQLRAASSPLFERIYALSSASLKLSAEEERTLESVVSALKHCLAGSNASPVDADLVKELYLKDRSNGFAIMMPKSEEQEKEVRGYGIYTSAAIFNHSCLPSLCRFDDFDSPVDSKQVDYRNISFRAMHAVPEGMELCISYLPIGWRLPDRQDKLKEEYNFDCNCSRCQIESQWSDDDEDEEGDEEEIIDIHPTDGDAKAGSSSEAKEEPQDVDDHEVDELAEGIQSDLEIRGTAIKKADDEEEKEDDRDDFDHAMYLMRFLCTHKRCGGTLAPIFDDAEQSMECNTCGFKRTEKEFLAELQDMMNEAIDDGEDEGEEFDEEEEDDE